MTIAHTEIATHTISVATDGRIIVNASAVGARHVGLDGITFDTASDGWISLNLNSSIVVGGTASVKYKHEGSHVFFQGGATISSAVFAPAKDSVDVRLATLSSSYLPHQNLALPVVGFLASANPQLNFDAGVLCYLVCHVFACLLFLSND